MSHRPKIYDVRRWSSTVRVFHTYVEKFTFWRNSEKVVKNLFRRSVLSKASTSTMHWMWLHFVFSLDDYQNISTGQETLPDDVDYYQEGMKVINQWTLLSNSWVILSLVAAYLAFVIRIGPNFMKNRKPYSLQPLILVYNVYQMIINAYIVSRVFVVAGSIEYLMNHNCYPTDPAKNPLTVPITYFGWMYFLSRIADFVDTIFLTLTKKRRLVTFLHVFHHTVTVLITFYFLKYTKFEQVVLWGLCNCVVHFFMYSYYFMAALGPSVRKYLWWKPYVTGLQLLQFVIVGSQAFVVLINDCPVPKNVAWIILIQASVYLVLFSQFFWETYIPNKNGGEPLKSSGIPPDSAKPKMK